MRSFLAPIACALAAMSVDAEVVDLNGVVSNSSGTPVANAIVSLARIGLKDTTGTDGFYAFASVPSGVSSRNELASGVRFAGRSLVVSLASPTSVSLDVFDVHGGLLQSIALPNASVGIARLDLSEAFAKAPMLLGRLRIGSATTTFRALTMGGNAFLQDGGAVSGAARALAVVDTLSVSAPGYVSKSVAVESYTNMLNVVLEAVATCDPADKTPDPVSVNVSNFGSPLTGTHQVVVETDPSLSGRTIYRPKDLAPGRNYPILVWGNGGCSNNATDHTDFHLEIASHGYVIIADGTPKGSGNRDMVDVQTLGAPQAAALTWGIQQNSKPCSRFFQALDTIHVAAFGWSCGGLMTYGLSLDRRIYASIIMSSGLLNPDQSILDKIHAPIAYVCGGSSDIAYENCKRDYGNMKTVPAILANDPVGHGGTYYADNGGEFAKIAIAWFDWWLKGDASSTGRGKFTDPNCQFCKSPWTLETKRLP